MNKKQIKWDRSYLIIKIANKGIDFNYLAKFLNISTNTLIKKLDGLSSFKIGEVEKIIRLLSLSSSEINKCFFNYKQEIGG